MKSRPHLTTSSRKFKAARSIWRVGGVMATMNLSLSTSTCWWSQARTCSIYRMTKYSLQRFRHLRWPSCPFSIIRSINDTCAVVVCPVNTKSEPPRNPVIDIILAIGELRLSSSLPWYSYFHPSGVWTYPDLVYSYVGTIALQCLFCSSSSTSVGITLGRYRE